MQLEHSLDPRRADPALEALDHASPLHESQRRHGLDLEMLGQLGLLVDVDLRHPQAPPLLAGEVGDEALHPARGTGVGGAEEDENGTRVGLHSQLFSLQRKP